MDLGVASPSDLDWPVISHRRAIPRDVPFVFDSWLRSFRLSHAAGPIPMDMYYGIYRAVIERVLARPAIQLWVAEDPAEGVIFGWLCCEPPALVHYCYVRESSRRQGVARGLFGVAGIVPAFKYTFKSSSVKPLRIASARFDPMAIR